MQDVYERLRGPIERISVAIERLWCPIERLAVTIERSGMNYERLGELMSGCAQTSSFPLTSSRQQKNVKHTLIGGSTFDV